MNAVKRLKRDHQLLRAKLDVLESALRIGPEAWFVLREVCFTLSRQLQNHIRREEALFEAGRGVVGAEQLSRITTEHQEEPRQLRALNRLFVEETGHSLEHLRPALTTVIATLRRHMAEEEAELFPALEPVAEALAVPEPAEPLEASRLTEVMTVNRIVQEFPHARQVLERFFINIPLEGCSCLDEVAWRHGMESRELLDALEAVIHSGRPSNSLVFLRKS